MQLKSEIWVKAYLRQAAAAGAMATIVRHGDDDAGAIFVKVRRPDGHAALYGPAPAGMADMAVDRRFARLLDDSDTEEATVDKRLADEQRFDPDVWLIEVEDRQGRHFLDDWLVTTPPDGLW
jgi:hypothetical protein